LPIPLRLFFWLWSGRIVALLNGGAPSELLGH